MIQSNNPKIITLCGLPAAGKGTLAKAIQNVYGGENVGIYNTDLERQNLGYLPSDREVTKHMYDVVLHRMLEFLPRKEIHILDITFFKKELREKVLNNSKIQGIEKHLITLDVPNEILRQRVEQRKIKNDKGQGNIYGGVSSVKVLDFLTQNFEFPETEELEKWSSYTKISANNTSMKTDSTANCIDFPKIFKEIHNLIKNE